MASQYDLIRDLTPMKVKSNWRIHVRALCEWKPTYGQSKDIASIQALLVDSQNPPFNPKSYPIELDDMLEKKCIFKLQLPRESGSTSSTQDEQSEFAVKSWGTNSSYAKLLQDFESQTDDNTLTPDELKTTASSPASKKLAMRDEVHPPSVQSTNLRKRKLLIEDDDESERQRKAINVGEHEGPTNLFAIPKLCIK
ncbi:OLC1v1013058C1 [Oldenlandia corymbosa var. corymbosa]|uniref:OLC1v1013058C1 n=1 Tax=Oldenlandia corymbosa var. corymbosa TaxID=529605 RepID=A0AAV1DXH7_OLDCO|nr:OLC1v1013058C1 [Oldenlandia corymbosa var. corymbosa]